MNPFRFTENRVWRCYLGGKLIDRMRGKQDGADDLFPEDWIASTVEACNPQHGVPGEGISTAVVGRKKIAFTTLVGERADELFGAAHVKRHGKTTGFLMKLLDSAIRLPLQAHPDRETARRLYGSDYGKTEVWIVLETRRIEGEEPYLLLGFNESIDKDVFTADCLRGDMTRPLRMAHKHRVKPGDVVMLTGGLVHAIGPGVFLVEIMEPTDLVTQPDPVCGKQPLTQQDRFGRIAPEKAMEVFHFDGQPKVSAWAGAAQQPRLVGEQGPSRCWQLIGAEYASYFGAWRIEVDGKWTGDSHESGFFAGVVVDGEVTLRAGMSRLTLKPGDTFFVPYSTGAYAFSGKGTVVCALPPG
ncbi:MAG: hypothetical protein A3K18_30330 [Lentisphaerae bacterium RIFOXYA12_64_32]|nr:MAG: hypothetical protein A3K18_30330 [Lentisphaerae bacterium RIFOXYA12_64_32]